MKILVLIKPDVSQDETISNKIIGILESHGPIVRQKKVMANRQLILDHYNKDDSWLKEHGQRILERNASKGIYPLKTALEYGQEIIDRIVDYMTSAKIIALIVEVANPDKLRSVIGASEPISAAAGTIRNSLSSDSYQKADEENRAIHNVIHCSDSIEEATREIDLWFKT